MQRISVFILIIALGTRCELPPQTEVYNYAFEMKEFEEFPLGWTYERGLPSSISRTEGAGGSFKPMLTGETDNPVILSQKVIFKDSGNYFVFGKIRADIERGGFFVSAEGETFRESVRFTRSIATCNRVFFSVHVPEAEVVKLSLGFEEDSKGVGYPDTLFFLKEEYFEPLSLDAREMRSNIESLAGITSIDEPDLDENVNKLSRMLTGMFMSSDSTSDAYQLFRSEAFDVKQTSYLHSYAMEGPRNNFRGYNQRISVSLDEILKLYRIPVRQLFLQDSCATVHHFIEYWDDQWKIVDPSFGVRYRIEDQYLGFEEVQALALSGALNPTIVKHYDDQARKVSTAELLEYWNHSATIRIIKK